MSTGHIGAVTVNYNAGDHLIRCVESLVREGVEEIVVVDNGSKDDSLAKLADRFPQVPVVHLPNPGFGAANNVGVKQLKSDLILLVNPDTVIEAGAIDKMREHLMSDERIGLVGPTITNPDGSRYPSPRRFPSLIDGTGHAIVGLFAPNNRWTRRYKMLDETQATEGTVDWVSGSAVLARREAFEAIGGFDEGYFMYMEDTDLCWRLRKAGWTIAFEPAATIMHVQGVSTRQRAYKMIRVHHQSLLRYHARNAQGIDRLFTPIVLIGIAVRLPIALLQRYVNGKLAERKTTPSSPRLT